MRLMTTSTVNSIQDYWQQRAAESEGSQAATTNDVYLRELEIKTIVSTVKSLERRPTTLLDVGCGDGYSTLAVAGELPDIAVRGIDYSSRMIEIARSRVARERGPAGRVRFDVGDALDLESSLGTASFDLIVTDRCLINLPSLEFQTCAINQIANHLSPRGHYLAIENFAEGQQHLNAARAAMGLAPIPVRWHNRFFTNDEFMSAAQGAFEVVEEKDFSSAYYFATRVIYSAMCQMRCEQPDYQHEIHRRAVDLPWTGQFSPIRMIVLRRK
jgi:SAM-dependent methyltransferase